jgi:glutamate/aspartate transport system permease protein
MALDFGVFCKNTLDGEVVDHCFSAVFGLAKNSDPSYLDWLLKAWGWTLAVAGLSLTIALILGAVMGTLRTLPDNGPLSRWLVRLSTTWVELFRNIPILVQVFIWYHVIPAFILPLKALPSYWLVSIALGFFTSAGGV